MLKSRKNFSDTPVAHHNHPNKLKWLTPPTIEQIEAVYKHKLKISGADFERFHKMPKGIIAKVRRNHKPMPAKYWHLFFEETESFKPDVEKEIKRTPESLSNIM